MQQAGSQKEEELYRVYENMAPEYRLYIRRHEFETLEQLTHMAMEADVEPRKYSQEGDYRPG